MNYKTKPLLLFALALITMPLSAEDVKQPASAPAQAAAPANPDLISLDLKGVDILEVFRMLSLKTGLNIVPTKSVTGRINLFINNTTFEDALNIILATNDLAAEREDNIIHVMTAAEYQALYGKKYNERRKILNLKLNYARPQDVRTALDTLKSDIGKVIIDDSSGNVILFDIPEKLEQMQKALEQIDQPLVTEVFELNYAKADDLEAKITKALSSSVHTLQIDKRTNKIIVTDFPNKMQEIKRLVKEFDEESREVLIETEIWQLSLSESFQRGIDWEKLFRTIRNLDFQGNFPLALASGAAAGQISVGSGPNASYNATMQLLSTYGKTDILSRPHIAVVNNEEAKILVGSKEAFITATVSQAQSSTTTAETVNYIDVGVKINVVPTINKDGFITMKIKPEVSSVRTTLTTAAGSQIPIVETSEVQTTVKVKDGSTILIAGLMKEKTTETRSEVPFLGRIPVLGWFFGNYTKGPTGTEPHKTELIIAITPHIISGESGSFENASPLSLKGERK